MTADDKQEKDVPKEAFSYKRMPEETDEATQLENSTCTPPQSSDHLQNGKSDGPLKEIEDSLKHEND